LKQKPAEDIIAMAVRQLDNASGELYNALFNLSRVVPHLPPHIIKQINRLDITLVDSIKNELEILLED
jgi:hypothetical protein